MSVWRLIDNKKTFPVLNLDIYISPLCSEAVLYTRYKNLDTTVGGNVRSVNFGSSSSLHKTCEQSRCSLVPDEDKITHNKNGFVGLPSLSPIPFQYGRCISPYVHKNPAHARLFVRVLWPTGYYFSLLQITKDYHAESNSPSRPTLSVQASCNFKYE